MRQHLTAVRAAAEVCGAEVLGAELGSTRLEFRPGPVRAGRYHFAVPGAGSACLVLQTVLAPLAMAAGPSQLVFEGGTHNPLASPYPFLDLVFFPLIERIGPRLTRTLERPGFYPAGGGPIELGIEPVARLTPLALLERGPLQRLHAEALVTNLPGHIAQRELAVVKRRFQLAERAHARCRWKHRLGHAQERGGRDAADHRRLVHSGGTPREGGAPDEREPRGPRRATR